MNFANSLRSGGIPFFIASARLREVAFLAFMAFMVFLVYSNTLESPYILDDEPHIHFNPAIRLTSPTLSNLLGVGFSNVSATRPVSNISFGLNYFFHQYSVRGYHVVNILIHITTGILLYFFIKTTINLPILRDQYGSQGWLPFAAATIWLLHPIQTQSITYIVQRMTSLSAMFYLLSFVCYVHGRLTVSLRGKWLLFGTALVCGIFALGSKEVAATLPFFILLYEWYFFQNLSWSWMRKRYFYPAMVVFILTGLVYIYIGDQPLASILAGYQNRDFTLGQRLLTEFRVVLFYLSMLFFPHPSRLNLDHDFIISTSLLVPLTTLLSMATILGLAGLSIGLAHRQRLMSFCILWFLGNLVIESSVIGLEIVFEHRNYLPSMLAILLIVILTTRCLRTKSIQGGALVIITVMLSVWTYERNWVWGNEIRLWADCANKSPHKVRPQNNLGTSMFKQGYTKEAIISYSKALQIEPDHAIAHNNLGFLMGSLRHARVAIMHYSEAIRIKPNYKKAHLNMSNVLRKQAHLKKELSLFNNLDLAESYLERGLVLAEMGGIEEALDHYSEALRINPNHEEVHFQRGRLLAAQGRVNESIHHFSEALQINPDDAEANFNMGVALTSKGRLKGAARHFEEALRLNPEDMEARQNLVELHKMVAIRTKAKEKEGYGMNLHIKPDYKKVHFDLDNSSSKP